MEHQNKKNKEIRANETADVLYQKMGDRWFAFSLIDDEIYYGSMTQEEADAAVEKLRALGKKTPRPS